MDRNGPSYVGTLHDQGKLPNYIVSFWLNYDSSESIVTFGGVLDGAYRGEFFSNSLVRNYNSWWTVRLKNLYYDDNSIK